MIRVLLVDDSASIRAVLKRFFDDEPDIRVVGAVEDAFAAREAIKELWPDVVILDVEMPGLNGLEFLDRLMRLRPTPVVMFSTLTQRGCDVSIEALSLGAVDCIAKPGNADEVARLRHTLPAAIRTAAQARLRVSTRVDEHGPGATSPVARDWKPHPDARIYIGASTGGVEALCTVLRNFPPDCRPTFIVQHMPKGFTASFAARLDRLIAPSVVEATDGVAVKRGHVYIAPGGERHMVCSHAGSERCRLVDKALVDGHRPAVDPLFLSALTRANSHSSAALLTGIGSDGAIGLKALREAGVFTIAQDEASSVVYGMPAAAARLNAADKILPIARIAGELLQACRA